MSDHLLIDGRRNAKTAARRRKLAADRAREGYRRELFLKMAGTLMTPAQLRKLHGL